MIGVTCGAIVYYIVYNVVILLGLKTDFLKMFSAIIVAIFIAVPYLKKEYFTRQRKLPYNGAKTRINGGNNA
jgi:putative ABC transport system permease protein